MNEREPEQHESGEQQADETHDSTEELSDEDLEEVNGGANSQVPIPPPTHP